MALTPWTVEQFGGLDLRTDPFEVGATGSVDLVNADFDKPGRIRCRDGFTRLVSITNSLDSGDGEGLAVFDTFIRKDLIVGYNSGGTKTLAAYRSTGGAAVATVSPTNGFVNAAQFGSTYLYIANGADTIRRWSGTAFASPGGMPTASYLAFTPVSGRLAAGLPGNRIQFSDPNTPETWGASNYVDLPTELITQVIRWQNLLFVFGTKEFFVFTHESVDADGGPVFNYRTVAGYGAFDAVVGREGVYFQDGRTVWLTTGDIPTRISDPIEPFLTGLVSVNGETVNQDYLQTHRISYSLDRLFLAVTTSGGVRRTLVYNPRLQTWTLWALSINFARTLTATPTSSGGAKYTHWLSASGIDKADGATTDNGSAISWSRQSGRYALADPGQVAIVPETSLVGSGTVTLRLDTDLYTNQNGSATLGTAPATAEGWPTAVDQEGTWLQHTLSGLGAATVSRLTHHVSSAKPAGVR